MPTITHDVKSDPHQLHFNGLDAYANVLLKGVIEPCFKFYLDDVIKVLKMVKEADRSKITELEQLVKLQADELSALRGQLLTLQSKVLTDGGIWKSDGTLYPAGQVVTRDGSAWVCTRTHAQLGPFDHTCWRLLVKRGRDGRDAADTR